MYRYIAVAIVVAGSLVIGCAKSTPPDSTGETEQNEATNGEPSPPSEGFSHVIISETAYYTTGPQQGRPPDGTFPAGTRVNVIEEAGSYTRVRSENGVEAFVAADALKESTSPDTGDSSSQN